MGKGTHLGEFEQSVLLALATEGKGATGRDIYERLVTVTTRDVSVAAVYMTLRRLQRKGHVTAAVSLPADQGRALKMFDLTKQGAEALHATRQEMNRLWRTARQHPRLQSRGS